MVKYIIKRLLLSLLILVGVSIIIYILIRLMPMDYIDTKFASQLAQGTVSQEDLDQIKKLYGLLVDYEKYAADYGWAWDAALSREDNIALLRDTGALTGGMDFWCNVRSYFEGYWGWLKNALQGDLGQSFKFGDKVTTVIAQNMMISFWISLVATVLQFLIAIPLGIQAATHQYGALDYTVTVLAMMGISLPTFFLGALMLSLFSLKLGWFPYQGLVDATKAGMPGYNAFFDKLHHLVLPIVTLVILSIGGLMRYTRTNMLEVLNADYIRTARAKGCSEKSVIYRHAFRNTLIPVVTMLAGILPGLFSGAMITEQVFSLPGIGNKAYQALTVGDVPFVMGYNMFLAILTVLGTLASDLMYAVVDPRVKITKIGRAHV